MITYLLIGLLALSFFSTMSYYFAINLLNRKFDKKNINYKNTFPFEVVPQFKTDNFFINILLFISLASTLTGAIIFASKYLEVMPVIMAVITLLLVAVIAALPFINIKFLKEHLYLSLALVVLFFALSGFLMYISFSITKLFDYKNVTSIIAMVVSGVLLLISLFFIFNPKLFNLNNEVKEDGEMIRPKVFYLALAEWCIPLLSPLTLVPLILLASIL
jgi:hypothetical protein